MCFPATASATVTAKTYLSCTSSSPCHHKFPSSWSFPPQRVTKFNFRTIISQPQTPTICYHCGSHCYASTSSNSLISFRTYASIRGFRNFMKLRCFSISWRWLSQLISIYLLCLNFAAEAHNAPVTYACEDKIQYYGHIENLKGKSLKRKLNSIIAPRRSLSYNEVWDALKILDAADVDNPEHSPEITEIYSLRVVSKKLAGKPEGWNREHLWPRSYGLTGVPSLTDLHNIRPADVNVNASRGNKYLGECINKSSKCLRPANKEAAPDTETDKQRWAPPMQVRGDIARALMYMAVSYGFHKPGEAPNLLLSDSPNMQHKEMGLLSTLLKWNEVDPPSREEKLRNDRICKLYQHNRNPFVDHPEFANSIWKMNYRH